MKMKNYAGSIALLLILLCGLNACNTIKPFEVKSYQNFQIEKLGFNKSNLKIDLEIYNPNVVGLELNRTTMDIFINGQLLGRTDQPFQVKVPRRNKFLLPVSIEIDMKNILKHATATLFNKEVTIRAIGTVRAGKGRVLKTIPFDYTSKQQLSPFY
jgi:LEA14-like dessication related protein